MRRPKKTNLRNVVLYVRVSTAEQAEQGLSLPAQRQALERYAADHGYEVLRSYEEAGASGTDDNRPAFRRMTGDLLGGDLAGRVDAILVYMTSRFMRDAMRAKVWKSRLEKAGIRVIATQQDFGTDPMGRLVEAFFESHRRVRVRGERDAHERGDA
jgi:site-specific DNA recombinase